MPDGILFDAFNQRVYVFSHPTMDATVIDSKDGAVLGTINPGGALEQAVTDGMSHIYVDVEDKANVAVIDAKTMTVTAHYDLGDKGSVPAGLALDVKNHVHFGGCTVNPDEAWMCQESDRRRRGIPAREEAPPLPSGEADFMPGCWNSAGTSSVLS